MGLCLEVLCELLHGALGIAVSASVLGFGALSSGFICGVSGVTVSASLPEVWCSGFILWCTWGGRKCLGYVWFIVPVLWGTGVNFKGAYSCGHRVRVPVDVF